MKRFIDNLCDRLSLTRSELFASAASVLLGGGYLVYTYIVICIIA